jgi:putative DNA primase/helicase
MNFETATRKASGRWHSILGELGVASSYLVNKHGPCPICGGRDRFRFDNKTNRGDWICSNCGAGDGFALVSKIRKISLVDARKLVEPLIPSAEVKVSRRDTNKDEPVSASRIWKNTKSITDLSPVWAYLKSRNCSYNGTLSLREGFDKNFFMAAKICDPEGRGVSLHKTYITREGMPASFKPNKLLVAGAIPPGSSIRLSAPSESMGVAEGIETALSAQRLFNVPTWSAISAPMLKTFEPPEICKILTIYADNDFNFTGQSAAYELARRLKMSKPELRIYVKIPELVGDWNDVLKNEEDHARN